MAEEEQEEQDIVVWGDNEGRIKTIQSWFAPGSVIISIIFYNLK